MHIPRIYHANTLQTGKITQLSIEASHHLIKVLRLPTQSPIILFNGDGKEYYARIKSLGKFCDVTIEKAEEKSMESPLKIHLGQCLIRGDKMDLVIQKAVELGVSSIQPLTAQNTLIKIHPKKIDKKLQHWQNIIISACEQCGRTTLPTLHPLTTLMKWLENKNPGIDTKLLFHPNAQKRISELSQSPKSLQILMGPESGFTTEEVECSTQQGFEPCLLGPRILRAETAPLAAISALQAHFGDF